MNVWCVLIEYLSVVLFVVEQSATVNYYLHFLTNLSPLLMEDALPETEFRMFFGHARVSPYFGRQVRVYFNQRHENRSGLSMLVQYLGRRDLLTYLS
jgi:hypothetical protein